MRTLTTALVGLVLVTGCSVGTEIDTAKVEKEITSGVKKQTDVDVTVSCPEKIAVEKGKTFTCDLELPDGSTQEATVEMDDSEGNISWNVG